MFLSCFRSKNIIPPAFTDDTNKTDKCVTNISDKCVTTTSDKCVTNTSDKSYISVLDVRPLLDSSKLYERVDLKDTVKFILPIQSGYVIKVYDGDTITIASKLPYSDSPIYRFSVRLNGIDCPEIKGKNENEKQCAKIAKEEITKLIMNKMVILKNVDTEKYGRILADVYIGDLHLNKYLIEKRLAVSYDGGTKNSPRNWMDYYCKGEM